MKRIKCVRERNIAGNCLVVGKYYYMDETTKYTDMDGDEYAKIYVDNKKEKYIGNLLLSHFCLQED